LGDSLRESIPAEFPDSTDEERTTLWVWLESGGERTGSFARGVIERHGLEDPNDIAEVPSLWHETTDGEKAWWRSRCVEKRRRLKRSTRAIRFRLSMIRVARRCARIGVLNRLRGADDAKEPCPYPEVTCQYLRIAYTWLTGGHRPKGDKPTELWQHIRAETDKSLDTIRQTFRRRGWYTSYTAPDTTPTEETVQVVLDEGRKYFG
jgi:hypothetical protein